MDIRKPLDNLASGVRDTTQGVSSSVSGAAKPIYSEKVAEPLSKFRDDPTLNPVDKVKQATTASKTVMNRTFDPRRGPHSVKAQKLVLAKGIFDVFLSLSLILFPGLVFDGPVSNVLSYITGLTPMKWETDSPAAFALSSLIMGCGFAGISAGESTSDDAYKAVAALNGIFALMSLLGCLLRPHMYGSSFLFIAGLQDVFWFYAITRAGNYPVLDTVGLNMAKVKAEADRLAGKAAKRYAAEGAEGAVHGTVRGVTGEVGLNAGGMGEEEQRLMGHPFTPAQPVN